MSYFDDVLDDAIQSICDGGKKITIDVYCSEDDDRDYYDLDDDNHYDDDEYWDSDDGWYGDEEVYEIKEGVAKKYQNPGGGLNNKGRAHYNSKGHDLKRPVSKKQAKNSPKSAARRKSFCSRMTGQKKMHNIDCRKDPDKAICKSLRKWDC